MSFAIARLALLVATCAVLAGCSILALDPVGVGSGADELKRSPCACYPVRQPGWNAEG